MFSKAADTAASTVIAIMRVFHDLTATLAAIRI
jgi:hypothetical protein